MEGCHVVKDEVGKDLAYKECFVKLVPLKNEVISTCSATTSHSMEMLDDEESFGAVTESVVESLKEERRSSSREYCDYENNYACERSYNGGGRCRGSGSYRVRAPDDAELYAQIFGRKQHRANFEGVLPRT